MGAGVGTAIDRGERALRAEWSGPGRVDMTDGTPTIPNTGKRGPRPGPMPVVAKEERNFFVGGMVE